MSHASGTVPRMFFNKIHRNLVLFLMLWAVALPLSMAADDQCWSGSSNTLDSSYPPVPVDCSTQGLVCEVAKVKILDLYTSSCVSETSCNTDKESVGTNLGLYDSVDCCTEDLCNSYPGQPESSTASSNLTAPYITILPCIAWFWHMISSLNQPRSQP